MATAANENGRLDRTGQTLLGKYELTRMLGKGGMGEVWEGEHTLTGRRVAVKILAQNYLTNRKVVARFGREARAASSISHAGIVEILDQDRTDDGVPFLVMEFLEGESVGERIRKLGKLTQDEALAIMLPLLDSLDAAHQAGIIHRDLKPDNVFILPGPRGEERIKILDFGISQKADEIEHNLTQEGSVLGTPHYMSPEQARGEASIDARVDVYATGVMFYECVVGDVPFDAGNYNALLQIILGTPPPSPRSRGADITPAVEQVLLAAMDKNKERRPPSARVFHDLLLEAGMQEEDALLDTTTWTFNTLSEPPPPIAFEEEEYAPEEDEETAPAASHPLRAASGYPAPGGVRVAPQAQPKDLHHARTVAYGDPSDLEADLFLEPGFPGAQARAALQQPVPRPRAVPAQPVRPAPFDPPMPAAVPRPQFDPPRPGGLFESPTRSGAFEAASQQRTMDGPSPYQRSTIDAAPRFPSQRPGERPKVSFTSTGSSEEHTLGRTIMSWVAVVAAIAALGYLASIVFTRPDPRKRRQQASEFGGGSVSP